MSLGTALTFREFAAPFVGDLLEAAKASGYKTEISPVVVDGKSVSILPAPGRPLASAGEPIVFGFLVVVGGGLTAGVTAALGADIYQELLKKPFGHLVRRLRGGQLRAEQRITLLAEVWFGDSEVLVQVVVQFRVDEPPEDVSEVLTRATKSAGEFLRTQPDQGSDRISHSAIRIVRVEVGLDGALETPVFVDPAHRLPALPHMHVDEGRGGDVQEGSDRSVGGSAG